MPAADAAADYDADTSRLLSISSFAA